MKFPDFDDETKEKMRMVFQAGMQPKITSRDFGKMSDEKLDEFISNNSHTIHILAATAERKRRDDAKAGEAENARYQSANRQSMFAIAIAAISLLIAILAWIFPRAPLDASQPHEVRSQSSSTSLTNMPANKVINAAQ
jgi:hypothetical protein